MRGEETVPMESGLRGPLVGLRVMDIATVYAAPFAAALLADYGAPVCYDRLDLTRSGGHRRVWRQSLREGSPHAEEYRVPLHTQEFKAEAVQLARCSPERSIRQLAYEL